MKENIIIVIPSIIEIKGWLPDMNGDIDWVAFYLNNQITVYYNIENQTYYT